MPQEIRAGISTHWQADGAGGDRVVLIHCTLAHLGAWQPMVQDLAEKHEVIRFDLPGHGRSDFAPKGTDLQAAIADIIASFVEAPAHVIGHSFGATGALKFAVDHPDLLRSLTLIEPVFFAAIEGTPEYAQNRREFEPFGRAMAAGDMTAAARAFLGNWGGGIPFDALPEKQQKYMVDRIHLVAEQNPSVIEDCHQTLAAGRLEKISCPVHFIQGETTSPAITAVHETLSKRIPNSSCHSVRYAGHMCPITHPKEVLKLLPF